MEEDAFFRLKAEEFDIIINLDTSKINSAITADLQGKKSVLIQIKYRWFSFLLLYRSL
jgi:hypothetical protein